MRSEDLRSLTVRLRYDVEVATETDEASDSESRIVAVLEYASIEGLTVREIERRAPCAIFSARAG